MPTLSTNGTAYSSETVWSGSGGGPSIVEAAQPWQINAGVLTGTKRGVPDLAFDADPNSGFLVLINGVPYADWRHQSVGTSVCRFLDTDSIGAQQRNRLSRQPVCTAIRPQ